MEVRIERVVILDFLCTLCPPRLSLLYETATGLVAEGRLLNAKIPPCRLKLSST